MAEPEEQGSPLELEAWWTTVEPRECRTGAEPTGWGGVIGLEAWRPEVEPEDPHHCAELGIGKPKAEPEGCMELAERAERRSWTAPMEQADPGELTEPAERTQKMGYKGHRAGSGHERYYIGSGWRDESLGVEWEMALYSTDQWTRALFLAQGWTMPQ